MPTDSEVLIEIRNLGKPTDSEVLIEIRNLGKSFGDHEVLKDISLDVHKGEVISIIGPSGCGKSTFLRSINLLEVPTSGTIVFEGVEISGLVTSERINQMRKEIPTLPKEERPAARTELREQKRELRASRKEARAAKREARMESGGTDSDQTATGPEKVDPNLIRQKMRIVVFLGRGGHAAFPSPPQFPNGLFVKAVTGYAVPDA